MQCSEKTFVGSMAAASKYRVERTSRVAPDTMPTLYNDVDEQGACDCCGRCKWCALFLCYFFLISLGVSTTAVLVIVLFQVL